MSADSYEVTNPEQREQLLEQARQKARDEKEERRETSTLKHRIERNLASETVALPVGGEAVEFDTFGRETSEWASILNERLRRLDGEGYQEEFAEEVDRIYMTLADHSEFDWMTRAWWEDHCGIRRGIQYLVSINAEQEVTEEEIKNSQRPR